MDSKNSIIKFTCKRITLALFALCFLVGSTAFSEEMARNHISIAHDYPFDHEELPQPGLPFELRAYAMNTKDVSNRMRLITVKDGVLSEIYPKEKFLNEDTVPEYVFTVYAPKAGMKYKFIINENDDNKNVSVASSDEFNVVRACLGDDSKTDLSNYPSSLEGSEKLNYLVLKARKLEIEIDLYSEAKNIINQINNEIAMIQEEKS